VLRYPSVTNRVSYLRASPVKYVLQSGLIPRGCVLLPRIRLQMLATGTFGGDNVIGRLWLMVDKETCVQSKHRSPQADPRDEYRLTHQNRHELISLLVGGRIKIDLDLCMPECFAIADVAQFETTLINLAVNGRDARANSSRCRSLTPAPTSQRINSKPG
jgi:hypothetical protein